MKCIFEQIDIDKKSGWMIYACKRRDLGCEHINVKSPYPPEKVHANCSAVEEIATEVASDLVKPHSLFSIPFSYAKEKSKWSRAGKPLRSDEEIIRIFDTKCKPCPYFNPTGETTGSCKICRCFLKREGHEINKIAWATTECPDNPPRWVANNLVGDNQKYEDKIAELIHINLDSHNGINYDIVDIMEGIIREMSEAELEKAIEEKILIPHEDLIPLYEKEHGKKRCCGGR
jgi:hypothetical protein